MLLFLLYKIVFILTAFGAGVIAIDIFLKRKERTRFEILFGLMSLAFVGWAAGRFGLLITTEYGRALSIAHFTYNASILVHLLFLHTILVFLGKERTFGNRAILVFFYFLNAFLLFVNNTYLVTGYHMFIGDVVQKFSFRFYEVPGSWHYLHLINYLFIPLYAFVQLLLSFVKATGDRRNQLKWVMLASFVGFFGGNSVVPLVYDIPIEPFLLILVPFYLPILAYAITRYHLFNIKVFTTELFVLSLWIFILVRTYISESGTEQIANIILLVLSIVIGVFLIRSVVKEVEQREKIEKLAGELGVANTKLETANERLKELDKLKSEFVSMATHQIRGPITAIKGYASMVLEGDYGEVPEKVRETTKTILDSSSSLAGIVQDFLDVSRIEQGRMKFEFSDFDLGALVSEVLTELKPNIENKRLSLALQIEPGISVHADAGKMKQVIENLVDNALKYTPEGSISVSLYSSKAERKAIFAVKDTGIGIPKETLPKLFQKFSRAEDASKANLKGTGLGLYVARQLVEAQGGVISAESEGEGKGATFSVELPVAQK